MIKDEKLRQMASEHWGADSLSENQRDKAVEFARLVEKENARTLILENRRMYCHSKGGHSFVIKGDFGSIRGSSTETVIDRWRAVGHCENCDARLVVRYPEDKS